MYTIETKKGNFELVEIARLTNCLKQDYILGIDKKGSVYNFFLDEVLKVCKEGKEINL